MADYLKSPVFSSPSYWIALGVGVVGIGAAAVQEGRKGSAAKVYDTPFDPSTMSDKPGSATPRQIAILMRMGTLLPDGKDVHGKTMRVSMRQASGLIRSMGEMRRADKAGMRGSAALRIPGPRYDESQNAPGLYPISSLRPGEYFKRTSGAKKVYRKGDYDRSERTYAGLDADDISRSIALKGDTRVYVGFEY
jgi:hypothetical protein